MRIAILIYIGIFLELYFGRDTLNTYFDKSASVATVLAVGFLVAVIQDMKELFK